jgi:glycosyltransferase involved in cell wall biosynthesis
VKIGLLTTSFPRTEQDVPGNFVLGFARALVTRGHRFEVLAPDPHEPRYRRPPSFEGIDVRWVRYLEPRALQQTFYGAGVLDNVRERPLRALGLAPFVASLAHQTHAAMRDWDAVVSHWALPCALIAGELVKRRPHLAIMHSADVFVLEQLPGRRVRALLAKRIAARAQALVFSSRDLRRRFLALMPPLARAEFAGRAHVCPMGIDGSERTGEPRALVRARLGVRGFTLLSLGRLIPLKGVEHAIDALAHVPEVELVVAGDGPSRHLLEQRARASGARVRFVGTVYGDDKRAWLRAADAFVLPSLRLDNGRSEGMPTALLEAMEYGLPVIASDVGGVSDAVRSGENGVLIPAGRPPAIADALRGLLDRSVRAQLQRGAKATAALYHWDALAPRFEELLRGP